MLVQEAKAMARQWVIEEASRFPGFLGAVYAGSINGLADAADLHHRSAQVTDALPALWAMTQTILDANPGIRA